MKNEIRPMHFPAALSIAIEQEASRHRLSDLAKAAAELSDRYRNQRQTIEGFSATKPDADWRHFAARFERSSRRRRIKGAELGYEDEKYSYIAASKSPVQPARARIIRHPMRRAGFTQLQLCAEEGLANVTVTRKDKEGWKRARKVDWGDVWDV